MEKIPPIESFEKEPDAENKEPKNESRRDFIKKGLAFLTVAAMAPVEAIGQTAEKERPVVDMVIEGQRLVMRPSDLEHAEKFSKGLEAACGKAIEKSFDAEIQKAIVANMGDKLRAGLLKVQELGFEFKLRDSEHAHLLVERALSEHIKEKYPNISFEEGAGEKMFPNLPKKKKPSREDMISLTKEIKALIFHCAEAPASNQIMSEKFMKESYPRRSIVVDDHDHAFDAKPKHPKQRPEGQLPDFGMLAGDYNELEGTDYHDLAVTDYKTVFEFCSDIQFIPASEKDGGVKLDPGLPSLKFALTAYENDISGIQK